MRRSKRNNKNNNKKRGKRNGRVIGARQQFNRNINLFRERITRNITAVVPVYGYITSNQYSFSTGADVRYYSINTLLASTEFTNMANVFRNFKIAGISIMINTVSQVSQSIPCALSPLFLDFDPNAPSSPSNPSNTAVIESDSSTIVPYGITRPSVCNYSFPGPGFSMNIWEQTSLAATFLGAIYIGGINDGFTSTSAAWFQLVINARCVFANPY
jgi:hypothetical protein